MKLFSVLRKILFEEQDQDATDASGGSTQTQSKAYLRPVSLRSAASGYREKMAQSFTSFMDTEKLAKFAEQKKELAEQREKKSLELQPERYIKLASESVEFAAGFKSLIL